MALTTVTCLVLLLIIHGSSSQAPFNPAILQDSRDLPKVDGAFGFLYRTEDGIAHAAKGEPGGVVRGRFTYTDPTGLKVNYNYNAGSRVTPKYNYDEPLSSYEQQEGRVRPPNSHREEEYEPAPAPAPSYDAQPQQYDAQPQQYDTQPQRYDAQPQQYDYVPQRKTRPPSVNRNSINTNYAY